MTVDWRLNKLQREAQAKRDQLDHLNRTIEGLDAMLEEAQDFDGHFAQKLADAEQRIQAVSTVYDGNASAPFVLRRGNEAERERLIGERQVIERERDEERARRTTTGSDGVHTLSFCALDPGDVIRRRARVVIARDQVARELAEIEEQMTPGELVQSGVEAPDYAEHRERVAAIRERIGAAS